MKKRVWLLVMMLIVMVLVGCQKEEGTEPVVVPEPPVEEGPLEIETLTVEISKGGLDAETLMAAVKALPELLERYFAETDVKIGSVKVTVGASPADTAKALAEGCIQLGFLPAESFLSYGGEGAALFADAQKTALGELEVGTSALICAAPTEYGRQLANRAGSGKPLSWIELENARWGVLETASLGGYRCFDLWLADEYEGNRITDLPHVTMYNSYEELFRAAAAEEIDALVVRDDAREDIAAAWTLDMTRSDESGMHGFDRTEDIWKEVPVLEVTETLYSQLAAVAAGAEELTDERFISALESVLGQMAEEEPKQMAAFGAPHFAAVTDEELDPMRRLVTIEE